MRNNHEPFIDSFTTAITGGRVALAALILSTGLTGCVTTPTNSQAVGDSVSLNAAPIPPGVTEAPAVAPCRVFVSVEQPSELDECVESIASDGTIILKPATMKIVEARLAIENKPNGRKRLWMMLTNEKSPSPMFPGPVVAYIGKGPSGVNLARQVAFFDNGPDFFEDGLARSVAKNGKIGFIDEKLSTVIREQYDFAAPFEKGMTSVCNGCKSVPDGDVHSAITGGEWLIINKFGKVISGPSLSQKEAYDQLSALRTSKPAAKAERP